MAGSGKATIDRVIGITQREEGHGARPAQGRS